MICSLFQVLGASPRGVLGKTRHSKCIRAAQLCLTIHLIKLFLDAAPTWQRKSLVGAAAGIHSYKDPPYHVLSWLYAWDYGGLHSASIKWEIVGPHIGITLAQVFGRWEHQEPHHSSQGHSAEALRSMLHFQGALAAWLLSSDCFPLFMDEVRVQDVYDGSRGVDLPKLVQFMKENKLSQRVREGSTWNTW